MKQIQASMAKAQFAELLDRGRTRRDHRHHAAWQADRTTRQGRRRASRRRAAGDGRNQGNAQDGRTGDRRGNPGLAGRRPQIAVPFVLDASVVGCWCFHGRTRRPRRRRVGSAEASTEKVPASRCIGGLKFATSLLQGERRGRLTEDYTARFFRIMHDFPIDHAPLPHDAVIDARAATPPDDSTMPFISNSPSAKDWRSPHWITN